MRAIANPSKLPLFMTGTWPVSSVMGPKARVFASWLL